MTEALARLDELLSARGARTRDQHSEVVVEFARGGRATFVPHARVGA